MATNVMQQPTYPGIAPTVQPRAQSNRGMLGSMRDAVFGKRDEHADAIKEMKRHGAGFRAFSRFISYVMLIAFSAQGVLAQVRPDAMAVADAIQRGQWPDINKALTVFVVVVFVLGLDLTIIAMSEHIRHELMHDVSLDQLWGALFLMIVGGAIEACTYIKIIVETEMPRTLFDWLLLIGRALFLPVVVVVLATLRAKPFTVKDFQQTQAVRLSLHVIDYINHALGQIDPREIDGGALISAFASTNDLTPAQAQQMQHHAASIAALIPNNVKAREQAEMQKIHAAYQQQLSGYANENERLIERVSALESAANEARMMAQSSWDEARIQADKELGDALQKVVYSLAYHHILPASILDRFPDLSELNVEGLFTQSRGHSRNNASAKVAKETPENAEGQRAFLTRILRDVAIKGVTIGTPTSRKGVWITPAVITVLSGGKVNESTAHSIVKTLNKGDKSAKIGTAYAAPFVEVMRYLAGLGALSDEAYTFWSSAEDAQEEAVTLRRVQ